jgi:hypothetical protein
MSASLGRLTVFAALVLAFLFAYLLRDTNKSSRTVTQGPGFVEALQEYGIPLKRPLTFVNDTVSHFEPLNWPEFPRNTASEHPQVTAVVLNWSRFENVLLITSLLCQSWLYGVIAKVVIWNNSPNKIYYKVRIEVYFSLMKQ